MATPKTIRAGQAYVELATRNNAFNKGLANASKRLKAWGQTATAAGLKLAAAGTAVVGPLLAANKHFLEAGDRLAKMSQRTGLSVEALSELEHAATQSGTSLETIEIAARELQKKGLDPRKFDEYAASVAAIEDPTARAQKAMELFGRRSGPQLLPMVNDLQALRQEARDLGLVMSGKDAQAAVVLGDALSNLWKTVKTGVFAIGAALEPTLTSIVGPIQKILTQGLAWVQNNRELFATIFKVAAAVTAAGAAFVVIGTALSAAGVALGGIASLFGLIGSALSAVLGVVGFLISPLGLVVALVAGLAGHFLHASGVAGEVIEYLGALFGDLAGIATESFGAIGKSLAAGDIALAAKVLWASLRLTWKQGTNWLLGHWENFKGLFVETWHSAVDSLASIFINAWSGVQSVWNNFVTGIWAAWEIVSTGIANFWDGIIQMIATAVSAVAKVFGATGLAQNFQQVVDHQAAKRKQRSRDSQDRLAELGQGNLNAQASIESDRQQMQAARQQAAENEARKRQEARDKKLDGAAAELAKAAADWQDAVSQADAVPALTLRAAPRPGGQPDIDLPSIDEIHTSTRRATSAGSFNAQAAAFLGGSSAADRTATATEKTAANTKKLLDQPGPAFS